MANNNGSEYDDLREQLARALEGQRRAEAERQNEATLRGRAEEQQRQAEERQQQAEEQQRQAEQRMRNTTLAEYLDACHTHLSMPLTVAHASRSTKGTIPTPHGKYCPSRLEHWADFAVQQAEMYKIVLRYLQPARADAPRLFSPVVALDDLGRSLRRNPISSEKDLEFIEQSGKDRHVQDVVSALCSIPAACKELRLGHGLRFDNHANALDDEAAEARETDVKSGRMQPDQFCVNRLDDSTSTLLMTVEYKPPHKLSVENLCAGLRPMDFWDEVVNSETVPTETAEKLTYNAMRLTGAALVQEYHVMIQEGLAYSYISTGIALVFLYVPEDEPSRLYYHLCVPNKDVPSAGDESHHYPLTAVARLLCFTLMCCATSLRSNAWRNEAKKIIRVWATDFEHARSQIPEEQLNQTPPGSEYVPSSPIGSPDGGIRRRSTRSHPVCTPSPCDSTAPGDASTSSESDSNATAHHRKRNHSQVASSPPQPSAQRPTTSQPGGGGHTRRMSSSYCTQRCLLGLRDGGALDFGCPNVSDHRRGEETERHEITLAEMVRALQRQLDEDVDSCEPFGVCGRAGAPFKLRCSLYGYTVVGKGTTAELWSRVSREAGFYQILRGVQGSAVPVFLGSIDMAQTYHLHGAGDIRHMLLMSWGGEPLTQSQWQETSSTRKAAMKSAHKIYRLGVRHGDLRRENILWNTELKRVLIIDFHKSELINKQTTMLKRKGSTVGSTHVRRPRLGV